MHVCKEIDEGTWNRCKKQEDLGIRGRLGVPRNSQKAAQVTATTRADCRESEG